MRTYRILGPVIVIALLVGCSKPPNDSAHAPISAAPIATPAPSLVPPSATPAPLRKEYSAPPRERLGVLAPDTGIPVGQKVPDLSARNLDGTQVTLSSLYAKGPILLAFYRGGWCPYCNSEIHALTVAYPEYRKLNDRSGL
jgi:thiol-disulfide isomerase/thioredoxin